MRLAFGKSTIWWLLLAALFTLLALNRHSRSKIYTYNSQIMSDKAGYYVYLPALFLYNFDAAAFPAKVDTLTGNGFHLDLRSGKVLSKYPVGTAFMQMPFFIGAHLVQSVTHGCTDGFCKPYQDAIDIGAAIYLLLGLWMLYQTILGIYGNAAAIASLSSLLLGTNLFYYGLFEGAYSHVYSFFLFSWLLHSRLKFHSGQQLKYFLQVILAAALMVLVRPLNGVFVLITLASFHPLPMLRQLTLKHLVYAFIVLAMVFLPQWAYNTYLGNGLLHYSYQNEGFPYLMNPKIREVLLGFHNGWILTNPLVLIGITGLLMTTKSIRNLRVAGIISLALCTWIYASWWAWDLGCAYGHRGFIDLYPLLAFGFAQIWHLSLKQKPSLRIALLVVTVLLCVLNIKYIYTYDSCWPKDLEHSDFEIYLHFLTSPTK